MMIFLAAQYRTEKVHSFRETYAQSSTKGVEGEQRVAAVRGSKGRHGRLSSHKARNIAAQMLIFAEGQASNTGRSRWQMKVLMVH